MVVYPAIIMGTVPFQLHLNSIILNPHYFYFLIGPSAVLWFPSPFRTLSKSCALHVNISGLKYDELVYKRPRSFGEAGSTSVKRVVWGIKNFEWVYKAIIGRGGVYIIAWNAYKPMVRDC